MKNIINNALLFALLLLFSSNSAFSFEGDFHLDGKENFQDFAIFAKAWRTQLGEPDFNSMCDISSPPDNIIDGNDFKVFTDNWLWKGILFKVYSDGWGDLLKTLSFYNEGTYIFDIEEENPYDNPPQYFAYAFREGFYTEMYEFTGTQLGDSNNYRVTVEIDINSVVPDTFNGTIFITQVFFSDWPLENTDVNVLTADSCDLVTTFQTDQQSRFNVDLDIGNYYFEFAIGNEYYLEQVTINSDYQDFFFPNHYQAFKPNIYLYPQETEYIELEIMFPHGGSITESIPDYNNGWQITVEPSGLINGTYNYLFYESTQPDYGQYSKGWVVQKANLESFFRTNLAQTGFNEMEIDDFIEYWLPRLTEYPFYAIYPQYNSEAENIIELVFSIQPDNLIRLLYSIRGLEDDKLALPAPEIPAFSRNGFTVTEWGVILK